MRRVIIALPLLMVGCATTKPEMVSIAQYQAKEQALQHATNQLQEVVPAYNNLQEQVSNAQVKLAETEAYLEDVCRSIKAYKHNSDCRCIHHDRLKEDKCPR